MTRRAILLREHSVHQDLRDLGAVVNGPQARKVADETAVDDLARIDAVVAYVQSRLASLDPELTQAGVINRVATEVRSTKAAVDAFIAGDQSQLGVASERSDSVLTAVAELNVRVTKREFNAARAAIADYRTELEGILGAVREARDTLLRDAIVGGQRLEAEAKAIGERLVAEADETRVRIVSEVASRQSELEALTASAQKGIEDLQNAINAAAESARAKLTEESQATLERLRTDADAMKGRLSDLSNEMAAERQRVTTLASEQQSQFADQQNVRFREWTDAQQQRQDRFNSTLQEASRALTEQEAALTALRVEAEQQNVKQLERLGSEFVSHARLLREEMEREKAAVEKLVGVIGELGITSGYQRTAASAGKARLVWQIGAVTAMVALIGVAWWVFLPAISATISWPSFAGRAFVTLTLGVLAAYAAKQADKAQRIETHNQKLALELAALDPFIARLPQEKQDEFRLTIGGRSFGQGAGLSLDVLDESPATLLQVVLKSREGKQLPRLSVVSGSLESDLA